MTATTATTAMTRTLPRRIASAAMTLALVVAAVAFWPAHLGGSTRMVLVSGTSMEPTYLLGDVVVVRSNDTPEVGDVVVFAIPEGTGAGMLVIHRIVGTDDGGFFVTQGDNRDTVDQWPLTADDIVGTPILRLPYAGRIAMALGRWPVSSVGLGLIATMVLWPRRRHDEAFEEQADGRPSTAASVTTEPVDQGRAAGGVVGEPVDDDLWQELDALLVETMGLEPTTPCLQSRCSSQLSYVPPHAPSPVRRVPRASPPHRRAPDAAVPARPRLAEHLDRLGFDEFWCGEHHSSGWETIASPEMFLAAAGQRTHTIRSAPGVVSPAVPPPVQRGAAHRAARPHDPRPGDVRHRPGRPAVGRPHAGHRPDGAARPPGRGDRA
jgi:signal peptidase I